MTRLQADVYIDHEPFVVSSYQRSTTDDLVARFGSAEQGETNLDLLKAATQKGWRGGSFQKQWEDPEMAGYISNLHHNPMDNNLYITPDFTEIITNITNDDMDRNGVTAYVNFNGYLYIAYRTYSNTNAITRINLSTKAASNITLPSALANGSTAIRDMQVHREYVFVATPAVNLYRFNSSNTFVDVGGTPVSAPRSLAVFRDKLYTMDSQSNLYIVTNEFTSSATFTKVKGVGHDDTTYKACWGMDVYNGALYIRKPDGLYRYDGIDVNAVINMEREATNSNFTYAAEFNGRYYFTLASRLYQFDGVNIEMLHDFSDSYRIIALESGSDRLWISARYNATGESIYIKGDTSGGNYTYGLFTFDGIGFFEYANNIIEDPNPSNDAIPAVNYRPAITGGYVFWIKPDLEYSGFTLVSNGICTDYVTLSTEYTADAVGSGRTATILGSDWDAGYPSVIKTINGVYTDYTGLDATELTITVYLRALNNGVWGDWEDVWNSDQVNSTDGISNDYLLHEQSEFASPILATEPQTGHKFNYKIEITTTAALTSIPRFSAFSFRYTLHPRPRKQWLINLPLYGNDPEGLETPYYADGTTDTRTATRLRRILYDAYANKKPVLFYDLDFSSVDGAVANAETGTTTIQGIDWLEDGDVVAIQGSAGFINRKIKNVTNNDPLTTFDFTDTGKRISLGAVDETALADKAQVRKSYAVYVRRISQERIIIDDNTINYNANKASDYGSELTIELIEV